MTEAKHTPGPWFIATGCSWRRVMAQSHMVCEPVTQSDGHPDLYFPNGGADGPDARLIAAAPAMLEALQDCRRALEVANFTQELAVVDAAIAAATGAAAMKEQA